MGVSILLLLFFKDLTLSTIEAAIFIALICFYLIFLFVKKEPVEEVETHEKAGIIDFFILPLSIAFVVAGGHFLVESSVYIARIIGLSEWIIGVTIVAFGTSAPEMATSLTAVLKGKHGLSAGNLIGSNIFNILGVLGLAGVLSTLTVSPDALVSMTILSIMSLIMLVFLRTGMVLSKLEGFALIILSIISYFIIFAKSL
jgi:cation:H+ antiporter